ncbi:type I-E CRISPR-associated protein Cas7/Cse4/CasC [Saccharomonospora xinjiangensis]|uniref:type I-E CRISPR-associated protein Cas7/Cse4/CasC n=1 Tax=Saccharomonospora xinjiangensis TaxID=75294 RepID=UPI00350FCF2B
MSPTLYVDVHVLQTVPPANINRDDNGDPKEAFFGGVRRSRVSSQAWKRATRQYFAERNPTGADAVRTKQIAGQLAKRLHQRHALGEEQAQRLANAVLQPLKIKPGRKAGETAYLLFFGYQQLDAIIDLFAEEIPELVELDDTALAARLKGLPVQEALSKGHPLDVALFGRMVAEIPALNVDAATQIAHALSTHSVELEMDYYTAVDDENTENTGAGMIGTVGFNSATLYRYATLGIHQLEHNLGGADATDDGARRFLDAFARSMPTGHTNSYAHRTRPSLVAVVIRADQPVNLVSAFENPVALREDDTDGIAEKSACRLAREYGIAVRQWGDEPVLAAACHTFAPDSKAAEAVEGVFGPNHTFTELLDRVHQTLRSARENA